MEASGSTSPGSAPPRSIFRRWWFWLLAAGLGLVFLGVLGAVFDIDLDWEGETYGIDLVNDTPGRLQFLQCHDGCGSHARTPLVDPGESVNAVGVVGTSNTWQVKDEAGNLLGCFVLDFEERPQFDLFASELEACP